MSAIQKDRRYSKEHEWAMVNEGDETLVTIGVSDYAQSQMGDVVMVELPDVGERFDQDEVMGAIESPKSVSDIFIPLSGEIVEINEALLDQPEMINGSPYEEGWIARIRIESGTELKGLMAADEYEAHLLGLEGDD